ALAPVGETPTVFADYLAVYHLTTTSDATGKGHTLVPAIPMTPVVGGVGKVTQFDGTQVLTVPTESDFDFTTQMSASVWFRTAGFSGDWQALVTKGDNAWRLHRGGGSQHLTFSTSYNGIIHDNFDGPDLALNTWHHVGISYENKTKLLVFDGGARTSSWNGPINTTNATVLIGENSEATGRRWIGQLDEVRIAATARTAAWFAMEYRVVADPTIVTVGDEQPY
ncbi:MAG: hypothetical protein NT062_21445, partial [Proteobacteria bacterium]|nr:hypothetical protein [Pseudomonadota bacterium]